MKQTNQQQLFSPGFAGILAACMLPLMLLAAGAHAQDEDDFELRASCTDVNDSSSCSFDENAVVSEGLVNLAEDLFSAIDNRESANQLCSREGDIATCTVNQLDLICTIEDDDEGQPKTASCRINGGLPPAAFAVDCSQDPDNSGACTLQSSGQEIRNALAFIENPQLKRVGENLLLGCVRRGGTEAFQRDCDPLLAALSDGNEEGVLATLEAITPLNADNAVDSSRFNLSTQLGHASQRLSRLRAGAEGIDVAGLQFFDGRQWLRAGDLLAAGGSSMNDASDSGWITENDYGRLGFFIDGTFITSEQDATLDENSAETDAQILTLGADYRFSDSFIGGLAFSGGYSSTDYGRNRGELDTASFLLMAYSSYYRGSWYLDATLALGGDSYDQQRRMNCDNRCAQAFNESAEAEFNGSQIAVTLGSGYEWAIGGFTLAPYAQLAGARLEVDGYRESPSNPNALGAGFALDIGDQEKDLLTLSIGSQFRYVLSLDWGLIVPHLGAEYVTELEDDDNLVNGSFVGNIARDEEFTLTTTELDDSYYTINAGVSFQFSYSAGFVDVKSWQGNDEIELLQFTVGWRWEL